MVWQFDPQERQHDRCDGAQYGHCIVDASHQVFEKVRRPLHPLGSVHLALDDDLSGLVRLLGMNRSTSSISTQGSGLYRYQALTLHRGRKREVEGAAHAKLALHAQLAAVGLDDLLQ